MVAQTSPEIIVRVRGLVNRFGGQAVHDGLDMDVREGEILGIAGGSGSGKTVLLHTILGLRLPDAGLIEFRGRNIADLSHAERMRFTRDYGVTFQNGALISSLTVGQNVELPLREHFDLSAPALEHLVALNLALVGLPGDAAGKYPAQLSGGMTKRAALARALALEPKLLLLDEPTAGLDPISATAFDRLLSNLHAQLRLTVVMITHDLDTLFATCDRVGVIVEGRMITDTLDGLVHSAQPWIREYFNGPRGRAAQGVRHG